MKLLLLFALLACATSSASMPTSSLKCNVYSELQEQLEELRNHQVPSKHKTEFRFRTPHSVKSACGCEANFEKELNNSVTLLSQELSSDHLDNILDNLRLLQPGLQASKNNTCSFKHHSTNETALSAIKNSVIKDNIEFLQKWNTQCNLCRK